MEFIFDYQKEHTQQLKSFLKEQGISKGLLAKIKFQGGKIFVNDVIQNVLYYLKSGDQVRIIIPDEGEHETVLLDETPIDIVFEDEHILVVNKPAGVSSIPAQYHPNHTMANRVKAHYKRQGYVNQVVHVVTRLDRDTSGLMLFAKHGFAHAKLDVQLREKNFVKKYQALLSGKVDTLVAHDWIELPIGRDYTSLIKRMVSEEGRYANTEYWLEKRNDELALVDIQLHTGRTHQIRVHFSAIGCPLVGDDMYGGTMDLPLVRQALHCYELHFTHPFTKKALAFQCPLPTDMAEIRQTIETR
ncbi:ribosomal large subunit pseudouridine synthase [Enterococcus sp. DIV2402]|uniref:Pseudouridine synthase n=1 Tax=Candidatus Enterococcus lowellii TaxID=2230877 RepID=A0ABZ2SUY0_9ENTE|nr:RluA family pseudouridine synthase [Enterococcus sp. DIV2402]MBO0464841.1 RluA family pseudouridine synthase [Enterococcus sp. DIV2402]